MSHLKHDINQKRHCEARSNPRLAGPPCKLGIASYLAMAWFIGL
jgi:hypothetical protein